MSGNNRTPESESERRNESRLKILELANMMSVPMALNAVVRLNVPNTMAHQHHHPISAADLLPLLPTTTTTTTTADPDNLQRLLRLLSSHGVFTEHLSPGPGGPHRKYSLTDVGRTLVSDGAGLSHSEYVLQHHQEALVRAWPLLDAAVTDPSEEPFVRANGMPAYALYGQNPEMNELMQRAMAGVSVPFIKAVLEIYDGFDGVQRIVDVGGSSGDCLRLILEERKGIKEALNFDLPEVVARAPNIDGVTHVGGDMFKSIPHGDVIFMKWVLTTWTDDECKTIMKNCYEALPKKGKLIACEPVLPDESDDSHRTRALLAGDIFVMAIYRTKGKHRTEEEFRQLGYNTTFKTA
ncbi:hypothetical protein Sjap_013664 [Stephania japonica]|uniref:O-methyltransferase n=1 Tax=Stephania japonica TaxID=461633 RepID=A0AAP0IY77_9MAGN|nr:COMT protein [Stephania japonica]